MKPKQHVRDWKPVRHGDTYCAPACGRGCTHIEFERATRKAKALAKQLGPSWKPNVWENLGWHYSAVSACGTIKVHPFGFGLRGFTVFVGSGKHATSDGAQWAEQGPTLRIALRKVHEAVRKAADAHMSARAKPQGAAKAFL